MTALILNLHFSIYSPSADFGWAVFMVVCSTGEHHS